MRNNKNRNITAAKARLVGARRLISASGRERGRALDSGKSERMWA